MTSRALVAVHNRKGETTQQRVLMPSIFTAPIRLDIVEFVHTNMRKNLRQPHGVNPDAGMKHSAESWGTGRAVARIPRVGGSGTHRSGQAAFGNMCRKGRMFAPLHIWRRWHRRINIKQKRAAVVSAIAASGIVPLVMARGHRIGKIPELPLVVDEAEFGAIKTTKDAIALLKNIGAFEDVQRVYSSKKIRAGKGKLRNRRYTQKTGPLIITKSNVDSVRRAFRNIPGVEIQCVERLNLLKLAPGGQVGRFIIWSSEALKDLDRVFGTYHYAGKQKSGYQMPRPILTNPDIARIINSNEVQSAIRPAKEDEVLHTHKKNPLKNQKAMDWLNPYAKIQRDQARKQQDAATKQRQEKLSQKRQALSAQQKKEVQQRKKASKNWITAIQKLQQEADQKAIAEEEAFKQLGNVKVGGEEEEEDQ